MDLNTTVVLKKFRKSSGSYDYLEFSTKDREFVFGNSGSHEGHGNTLIHVEVSRLKDLKEKKDMLENQGFKEIRSFNPIYREED